MVRNNPAKLCFVVVALFLLCASECWAQQAVTTDTKLTERPGGAITGRVTNSAGEPLSGAVAYVGPLGSGARSQSTAVDNNGEFKIEGLEVTGTPAAWTVRSTSRRRNAGRYG